MNSYIEKILKRVEERDGDKKEFMQCVREVYGSLEKVKLGWIGRFTKFTNLAQEMQGMIQGSLQLHFGLIYCLPPRAVIYPVPMASSSLRFGGSCSHCGS